MDGDGDTDDRRVAVVRVWACNRLPVDVFCLCQESALPAGLDGVLWQGIAAQEIHAACTLLRIPRHRWPAIAADVRYMGECVARERNRRAKVAADRARRQ